jgi:thiol-disulfide isomerase/thioredoxin
MSFTSRRLLFPALGLAALIGCNAPSSLTARTSGRSASSGFDHNSPVALTVATSAGLEEAIREQKGKVVMLDAWFLACGPCVKKFPHVVELAHKYGPDGLTVMSVDVWEDEIKTKDDVLDFLKAKGATFPNFILSDPKVFEKKYGIEGTPAVVLFDKNGQRIALPEKPTDDDVEAAIRKAL